MMQTVHASHDQQLYLTWLRDVGDVADLVGEHRRKLETFTSVDGRVVVWFSALRMTGRVNHCAVEMLLAVSHFMGRDVPLLRGNVVVTGRDSDGGLAALTNEQVHWLINVQPSRRDERVLGRRFARDARVQLRESRSGAAARQANWRNA